MLASFTPVNTWIDKADYEEVSESVLMICFVIFLILICMVQPFSLLGAFKFVISLYLSSLLEINSYMIGQQGISARIACERTKSAPSIRME